MRFVVELCDQITVLDMGRVIASGKPSEVVNHPDVVQSYLGYGSSPMLGAGDSPTFQHMSQPASMKFVLGS
jgi:ABC-type hemin transport system ATPase subunit